MRTRSTTLPKPTDAELTILRCLWRNGPCPVRALCDALKDQQNWGYTTVLKFLQIMTEKGLVTRLPEGRAHIYTAAIGEADVEADMVSDFIWRVFQGSARKLVLGALATGDVSTEELAEIKGIVESLEGKQS